MGRSARRIGLICLGAALGAFAAIPALHLVGHEDDHVHIDGAVVPIEHLHEHSHPHEEEPREPAPDSPFDHGSGSVAHFGAASLEPDRVELTPILGVTRAAAATQLALPRPVTPIRRARAPPAPR